MATDTKRISIGRADVSVSDYVTAAGAGTFTDVGHTQGPTTLEIANQDYEIKSEQVLAAIASIPVDNKVTLKFTMLESALDNLRYALRQVSGNLTGSAPNKTLLIGDAQEVYQQMKLVSKGIKGATLVAATRTITIWRAAFVSAEAIGFAKDKEQLFTVTMSVMYDDSVATADKYLKIVDSGGA